MPRIALGLRKPSESQGPCEATDPLSSMTEEGTEAYTGEGACPKGRSRQSGHAGGGVRAEGPGAEEGRGGD